MTDTTETPEVVAPEPKPAQPVQPAQPSQPAHPAQPAQPTQPVDMETEDVPEVSFGDFFRRIYQVTYSKTIGLILILAMAVFVLLGVVIAQAPAGVWGNPEAQAQYLTQMRSKYGGWASLFDILGLFHIFTSIGFYVVVVALAISILGCTTHRIPQLWQRYRHPKTLVSSRFFTAARYQGSVPTSLADGAALALAADKLKGDHYRVIISDDTNLYADKYSWGGVGTVVAHLSFIIILAAFLISGLTGYETVLNVPVGGTGATIPGTQVTVSATSFNASYDPSTGRPLDYVSHIVVRDDGAQVGEQDVRVNEPLSYKKWSFHQNSFGLSMDVSVTDNTQATIFSGAVPQQWTSDNGQLAVGRFAIPERGLTVDVLAAASGASSADLAPGQVAFLIYRDGETEAMGMQVVDQGSSAAVGDLTFAFDRESQYTGIMVRDDPGSIWMWTGSILLVAGMTVTFACRHRRVWVRAQDGNLLFASADKEDSSFRHSFTTLVSQAETWTSK